MSFFNKYIGRFVAENRKSKFTKSLVKSSKKIINFYENYNYDFYTNGEFLLLKKLTNENFKTIFDGGANIGKYAKIC
ncbi:MAG: hypothetical protein Q8N14_04980, partial [Candidatus Omnitrophota bacterium]|nr:hypothetical protein [Candidatus Omnitrophota bacterium]